MRSRQGWAILLATVALLLGLGWIVADEIGQTIDEFRRADPELVQERYEGGD